jgi:photosystem II P680 reaction center D1 protein
VVALSVYLVSFILAPSVDIDGIREPVAGSLLYGNITIVTCRIHGLSP